MLSHGLLISSLAIGAVMAAHMLGSCSAGLSALYAAGDAQSWRARHSRTRLWIMAFLATFGATALAEWCGW